PADDANPDSDRCIMSIAVGSTTAAAIQALVNMHAQLDDLSRQLGTGQKSATYSGLQAQAGVTVGLDAQLSAIDGFSNTINTVGTTLTVAQTALTQIASVGSTVKQAAMLTGTT